MKALISLICANLSSRMQIPSTFILVYDCLLLQHPWINNVPLTSFYRCAQVWRTNQQRDCASGTRSDFDLRSRRPCHLQGKLYNKISTDRSSFEMFMFFYNLRKNVSLVRLKIKNLKTCADLVSPCVSPLARIFLSWFL